MFLKQDNSEKIGQLITWHLSSNVNESSFALVVVDNKLILWNIKYCTIVPEPIPTKPTPTLSPEYDILPLCTYPYCKCEYGRDSGKFIKCSQKEGRC